MSGENVQGAMGNGQKPEIEVDWRTALQTIRGKRVSHFKPSAVAEIEEWEPSSNFKKD